MGSCFLQYRSWNMFITDYVCNIHTLNLKYDIFLDTQVISEDELKNGIRGKYPVFQMAINEGLHA